VNKKTGFFYGFSPLIKNHSPANVRIINCEVFRGTQSDPCGGKVAQKKEAKRFSQTNRPIAKDYKICGDLNITLGGPRYGMV